LKLSTRLFRAIPSLVKKAFLGVAFASSGLALSTIPAKAEITYPVSNGQVIRFYLDNGQGINLTNARGLVDNGYLNSWDGSDTDPEQQFKVISDGAYYLFQRNGTNFGMSSSTLTPVNNSPMVSYTTGAGRWQNFLMDDLHDGHYLLRWKENQNWCVNIPGGYKGVSLTFWPCSATDPDQRFRIYTTGGLPSYKSPIPANLIGSLQSKSGQRLTIPGNNVAPGLAYPNNNDPAQQIQFVPSGNGFLFQRVGTNISLSSNTLDYIGANQNGLAMTTYTTGGGCWQNFGFVDAGNGWYQIKWQFHPGYCVSAGTASGSNVGVILPCNSGDSRQLWTTSGSNVTYQDVVTEYYYAVIASGTDDTSSSSAFTGHTWAGVFKLTKTDKRKYVNRVYDSSTYTYDTGSDKTTVSAYPSKTVPTINYDRPYLDDFVSQIPKANTAFRYRSITAAEYATAISANTTQTGCTSYPADLYVGLSSGVCNCSQAALSYWKLVTKETIQPISVPAPIYVRYAILNSQNGQSMTFVKP
jgi:hypothetical protein